MLSGLLYAQEIAVKGKVTDASDGSPIPGVNVVVKGTTNGTVTNSDGQYSISSLPKNATLVFSFVGMKTQEVLVKIQTTINITMIADAIKEKGFDHLSSVVGVDYPENFEVVYHVWSYSLRELISLKVPIPKDDPKVKSVTSIWRGANWHERETAEMFGIIFEGHPDPRKLLLPDDFEGYPLRKDFKLEAKHWLPKEGKDVQA